MNKPKPEDYSPYMAGYISLVIDEEDILSTLTTQINTAYNLFNNLDEAKANHAYGEGKWTLKQVVGHMIDAERTFAYRILVFSRGQESLPGFDENTYVEKGEFNSRTIQDLAAEFKATRESNLYMLRALTPTQLSAEGIANDNRITVTALIYIMAGHERHHLTMCSNFGFQVILIVDSLSFRPANFSCL
jgi:uncharacterized damage-inducible protein DinB